MQPVVFAHRGASGVFAEHTRAAYMQALAEGTDGVECDIHLTADKQLVLIHDATLDRTSNAFGAVGDYTLEQLRAVDFTSWKGTEIPAGYGADYEQLLTLIELLDILQDYGEPIRLAVECKHPDPFGAELEQRLFDLLSETGWDRDSCTLANISFSFMSFSPQSVERLLAQVPPSLLCQLLEDVSEAAIARAVGSSDIAGSPELDQAKQALADGQRNLDLRRVAIAGPGVEYIRAHLDQVKIWVASGLTFRVWTVNSAEDIELCAGLGIQEVTTDWPARTAARFKERERAAGSF